MQLSETLSSIDELVENYERTGQVIRWRIPEDVNSAMEVTYRNRFAEHLAIKSVEEICERHVYLTVSDMEALVRVVEKSELSQPLSGVGIELGAGCGLLSATVAKRGRVRAVLALEVCSKQVELLIPKVAADVLGPHAAKVVPVVGTFDELHLPDNALDFVVEIHSLHHSHDLKVTMAECARVIKPGAVALCFDRVQPNSLTDHEVEQMLSKVYSREFLIGNAYPPDITLTRRDNGEHEFRRFEWEEAFHSSGLQLEKLRRCDQWMAFRKAVKGLLSLLPASVRNRLYKSDNATIATTAVWLAERCRCALRSENGGPLLAPMNTTVMVLRKP